MDICLINAALYTVQFLLLFNLTNSFILKPSVGAEGSCKQGAIYTVFRYYTL